jgi:MFS family permease
MAIAQLVMSLLMVITPLHMDHYDHSTNAISFVISAHTFGMFALSGVTGWLIDRYGRVPLIMASGLILISAALLAPLSTAVAPLAFTLFLLGLGWNFGFIASSSLLTDSLAANERPRTQGISELLVALAAASAGLLTGPLFARAGITAVSALALACSLALLGFLAFYALSKIWISSPKTV